MVSRYTHHGVTWIDLESPTESEIQDIAHEFALNPFITEELYTPTPSPRADFYENGLFAVLHFPASKHTHYTQKHQEVDCIVGESFVISVHYDTIDALHKFSKVFEVHAILDNDAGASHGGELFVHLIRKLYRSVGHELEYIHTALKHIEQQIFAGKERDMVVEISLVGREILNFNQALSTHRPVLTDIDNIMQRQFGSEFAPRIRYVTSDYEDLVSELTGIRDTHAELRDTNDSLLFTKQNEIMKILTILAFVTFPLNVITGIISMDTVTDPFTGFQNDLWFILTGMTAMTILFFGIFKYKRWL
jgi:magnesium transporter